MWESPVYSFNVPTGTKAGGVHKYRQVVIDVTRSAPSFDVPGKTLSKALRNVLDRTGVGSDGVILDFGAGKLRNSLFLLEDGRRVCAVEYEKLFQESDQAAQALTRAKRFSARFSKLVFPHQFVESTKKVDLVLLINVLNVMPVPAERLEVLRLCREKLRKNGYLLWYTQRGDRAYTTRMVPQYKVGDGYFVGQNARFKTFYREFTVADIDELLTAAGFEFVSAIDATSRNQARLYQRSTVSPIAGVLDSETIDDAAVVDPTIPAPIAKKPRLVKSKQQKRSGDPDPEDLRIPALYRDELAGIPTGAKHAARYQRQVKAILELLFKKELRKFKLEAKIFEGRKRLDILARNKSKSGFFHSLKNDRKVRCPYIVIECKNYKEEPKNPEFDQLGGRLGYKLGRVGILAYRSGSRGRLVRKSADILANDRKLLIPLSDDDLANLLRLYEQGGPDSIEDYLDDIVQAIDTA